MPLHYLLHTHETLRLVLDVLDEDDVLCAALCCSAMRDAALARFPHGIRTRADAACVSAARVAWAMSLGAAHAPLGEVVCVAAARLNRPSAIRTLLQIGITPDDKVLCAAARHGALFCVEWLMHHCKLVPGPRAVTAAAEGGHARVLNRFLAIRRVEWDAEAYVAAARSGSVECLRLLVEADDDISLGEMDDALQPHPAPLRSALSDGALPAGYRATSDAAAEQEDTACILHAATNVEHDRQCASLLPILVTRLWPFRQARERRGLTARPSALTAATDDSSLGVSSQPPTPAQPTSEPRTAPLERRRYGSRFASSVQRRWDERACEAAARAGHIDALHLLVVGGAPCTWLAVQGAARRRDVMMVNWLAQHGCEWRSHGAQIADAADGDADITGWMQRHGWQPAGSS